MYQYLYFYCKPSNKEDWTWKCYYIRRKLTILSAWPIKQNVLFKHLLYDSLTLFFLYFHIHVIFKFIYSIVLCLWQYCNFNTMLQYCISTWYSIESHSTRTVYQPDTALNATVRVQRGYPKFRFQRRTYRVKIKPNTSLVRDFIFGRVVGLISAHRSIIFIKRILHCWPLPHSNKRIERLRAGLIALGACVHSCSCLVSASNVYVC